MTPRLTILMPMKGRHLFTLRFLWHANKQKLPYRFLIADGQVHPKLAQLLERPRELFPELDVEYVPYPNDVDFRRFFAKMSDALQRVRTPYVMLVDNDDFLAFSGIERSLDFLDANPDYVCCGGGLAGFSVYSGLHAANSHLTGPINRYAYRYTIHDRSVDFSSSSAVERLRVGSRNWWSYYAVFRADAQRTIWREVVDIDFSDLQLHELFCAMRTLTLGKARSDGTTIAYLRQYDTSQGSSFKNDWVHHLLRSRFTSDFAVMIERISGIAAKQDNVDPAPVAEMLREICDQWLREFLRVYYGSLQDVKQFLRDHAPEFYLWLKKRRRYFLARERARIFANLAADGASDAYIAAFRRELGAIEDVLDGRDFADFIRPYIAVLDNGGAATSPVELPNVLERPCA